MATKRPEFTWENGYQELAQPKPEATGSSVEHQVQDDEAEETSYYYVPPPSVELVTSPAHNDLGVNVIRCWPTLYDGTNSPHGTPAWWQPKPQVDVLIVGGKTGPSSFIQRPSFCSQTHTHISSQPGPVDWASQSAYCDKGLLFALLVRQLNIPGSWSS
jgi:hypothetical protein